MPRLLSFKTRLQGAPVWDTLEFLLNGIVFILIGLQLPEVTAVLSGRAVPVEKLIWYAVVISFAVIMIRICWVFPATYLPRLLIPSIGRRDPCPSWRQVSIVAWTGMRGVVSLAAALAIPLSLQNGAAFPARELILFLTFVVILATLVLQGLSLPFLIRWLGIPEDRSLEREELEARLKANKAALEKLNGIWEKQKEPAKADALRRLRVEYEDHIRQLEGAEPQSAGTPLRLFSSEYERLSQEALHEERVSLIQLRDADVISDEVLRRIQRDVDLAEARLQAHR
jgi:monovalent cation/hydrogen antiporter